MWLCTGKALRATFPNGGFVSSVLAAPLSYLGFRLVQCLKAEMHLVVLWPTCWKMCLQAPTRQKSLQAKSKAKLKVVEPSRTPRFSDCFTAHWTRSISSGAVLRLMYSETAQKCRSMWVKPVSTKEAKQHLLGVVPGWLRQCLWEEAAKSRD